MEVPWLVSSYFSQLVLVISLLTALRLIGTGSLWKGLHPQVTLNNKVYEKRLTLTDLEMELLNNRLETNPSLLKWDILIKPLETAN
jgi:hypothetical protein